MSRPVMYIFLNRALGMSTGKAAAQAAHAAIEGYRLSDQPLVKDWYSGGHYTKLVMQASNEERLLIIQKYLEDRGFKTSLIIDEGMTEIDAHQATALGVQVVDKEDPHTEDTFSTFELYKETIRVTLELDK